MEPAISKIEYSRANPSPRYRELVTLYNQMHTTGEFAQDVFSGISLEWQAGRIANLIKHTGAETLLDYGCGKGLLYRPGDVQIGGISYPSMKVFWGLKEITLYDPAYPPYMSLPEGKFDGVICTDVLEHCPQQDIPWILDELFGYANKFVFANIACYPAQKTLPNGENAHCTVQPPLWWQTQIMRAGNSFPHIQCQFVVTQPKVGEDGQVKRKESLVERIFKR